MMNKILKRLIVSLLVMCWVFSDATAILVQPKVASAASVQGLKLNRCGRAFKIKDGMIYFQQFLDSDRGFGKVKRDYISPSVPCYMATSDRRCKKIKYKKAIKYIMSHSSYNLTNLKVKNGVVKVVLVGLEKYVN